MAEDRSFEVGYKKPPVDTRFRKGQSGNPAGRPKGSLNFATVLERILREQVIINENGRRKKITKLEAALKQLANKSAGGDLRAVQVLLALVRSAAENLPESPETSTTATDEQVMANILMRLQRGLQSEGENNGDE